MSRAWLLCTALVTAAVIGGTALDPAPQRPPVHRGPWRVLEVDFHAHTRFSDGLLSPIDVVALARRHGLDAVAVTEHNLVFPGQIARWYSRLTGGPLVLVGQEVTSRAVHVHAIGVEERVDWDQPVAGIVADIHAGGGVAIGAHPFGRFRAALRPVLGDLDGLEVMHPLAYFDDGDGRWTEMRDFYDEALAAGHAPAPIGASDYHGFNVLGLVRTHVFVEEATERAIVEAVRDGRTVVHDLHGRAYGPPGLVALLGEAPVPPPAADLTYGGAGPADRVLRTVGWLGLLGLVLLAPRRTAR